MWAAAKAASALCRLWIPASFNVILAMTLFLWSTSQEMPESGESTMFSAR